MSEDNAIITYETLYEILRREKLRPEIQELDESFYNKLTNYLKEKKDILESQKNKESIFTSLEIQKTSKQIENIIKIITEIYEKRESKIIQLALLHSKNNSSFKERALMLKEERHFFDSILDTLMQYRSGILENILKLELPEITNKPKDLKIDIEAKKKSKKVIFVEVVPEFVGLDLNNYGPYEKEDIGELPEEVADLLIRRKVAKILENEST